MCVPTPLVFPHNPNFTADQILQRDPVWSTAEAKTAVETFISILATVRDGVPRIGGALATNGKADYVRVKSAGLKTDIPVTVRQAIELIVVLKLSNELGYDGVLCYLTSERSREIYWWRGSLIGWFSYVWDTPLSHSVSFSHQESKKTCTGETGRLAT